MRKLIVAILSLSSVMLHAQASTPAQTQVANNGPAPQARRISTGVIAPKLISTVEVVADTPSTARQLSSECHVVVGMIVDKTGKPSDLKIVRSPARVDGCLARVGVTRLAAVVPVHTHFDHALDSALVADRTGAQLVGGESAANVGRGHGLEIGRAHV